MYALDALAAAAGLALAASEVLGALDHGPLLVLLAASYVAWGTGLRANLVANQQLLDATGTSTSALSKGAYDAARRWTSNPRAARIAAAAGYVVIEVAKEAPYYTGAFGAVLLTDTVSSLDAIVFLTGANLGAAAYEYGLANLTGAFLRHGRAVRSGQVVSGS